MKIFHMIVDLNFSLIVLSLWLCLFFQLCTSFKLFYLPGKLKCYFHSTFRNDFYLEVYISNHMNSSVCVCLCLCIYL